MFEALSVQIINYCSTDYIATVSLEQVLEAEKTFYKLLKTYWYEHNYLTPRWWFLVALSIFPAIIWWKLVDKGRLIEIVAFGLFYGVIALLLDSLGSNALAWTYPVRLAPYLYPQFYPYDVGVIIVPFMLIYQRWGEKFSTFAIYTLIVSLLISFVAEPLMEYLKIYKEIWWSHLYSLPIYWLISLLCWLIIKRFKRLGQQA